MNPKLPRLTRDVESSHLSPQQMQAIAMLLSGKSLTAVAEELRCSRKTLAKWKSANPHFIAAFNERKNEIFESANHRLQSLVAKALDVLEGNLDKGNCSAAINVLKIVDLKPKELETDREKLVRQQAENIALSQMYDVVPFSGKPATAFHSIGENTKKMAGEVCGILRSYYGIETETLEELHDMKEQAAELEPEKLNGTHGGRIK